MAQHLADLGVAAVAVDASHQVAEPGAVRHPARGAAFVQPAEVDELHVEPADRRRLAEHLGLQPAGGIPGRLAAHGGVEREDQPAALAGSAAAPACGRAARNASISARGDAAAGSLRVRRCRASCQSSCRVRLPYQALGRDIPHLRPIRWHLAAPGAMALVSRAGSSAIRSSISSGRSCEATHSARAAARRRPFSSIGSFSASISARTSCRAVRCDRFGRCPSVASSRLSSAVRPCGKELAEHDALGKAFGRRGSRAASRAGRGTRRPASCCAS